MDESTLKFEPGIKAEVKQGKKVLADFEDTEVYSVFEANSMYIKIVSKTTKKEITVHCKK
jgi:hypothetical protein